MLDYLSDAEYNAEQIHLSLMTYLNFHNLIIKETECLK